MSQIALPVSDVSVSDWTPTPVWQQVNLLAPDDVHQVTTGTSPNGARFKVNLARLAFPDSGPQVLTVRLKQTGTPGVSVGVILWQGTRAIAATNFLPTTSFDNYTINLSDTEIARITDYANLQVEVASPATVSCCPNEIPAVLRGTVTGGGLCDGSYLLINGPGNNVWHYLGGMGTCNVPTGEITVLCINGVWSATATGPTFGSLVSADCGPPIVLVFTVDLSHCGGSSNATLTVTV
jgi:hypothetical protein